jgi:hypothetical protein
MDLQGKKVLQEKKGLLERNSLQEKKGLLERNSLQEKKGLLKRNSLPEKRLMKLKSPSTLMATVYPTAKTSSLMIL